MNRRSATDAFGLQRCAFRILVCLLGRISQAVSQTGPRTAYTVICTAPEQHLAQVQVVLAPGQAQRELQLPVWNALYQVRDFSQYVNWIRAKDRAGNALAVRKLDKSRWQIQGAQSGAIVEYEIYLDSPGPFGAQLNQHHAFLNLAQVLMYPIDARSAPLTIRFSHFPAQWRIVTPLRAEADTFVADSYDGAVDSPVEIGDFQESDFDESGAHFRVIVDADAADYDMANILSRLAKIVSAATSWM